MKILVYSAATDHSIESQLGMADYSYYFVKKAFIPVLQRIGDVIDIAQPDQQVDAIFDACRQQGEFCVFLSFTPPHKTNIHHRCPTICVFAWEYATLPSEPWGGDEKNDWRLVLGNQGFAITHSNFAAKTVHEALRTDFPIVSLPSPLWDDQENVRNTPPSPPHEHQFSLSVKGTIIDTGSIPWDTVNTEGSAAYITNVLANKTAEKTEHARIEGVVYTAVFNPNDGRKNWPDLVSAFCWAFREQKNATLILKLTYRDAHLSFLMVLEELRKRLPFECRIILIHGYLPAKSYADMIAGTHFTVNSSYGEGQCLPLMEFMSAGKPAVAPDHTAMRDYIDSKNAFIVKSSREWTHWPHDPRALKRTFRFRINWESLKDGFEESYRVATLDWPRYLDMSNHAQTRLQEHCSKSVIESRLREFLELRRLTYRQFDPCFAEQEARLARRIRRKIRFLVFRTARDLPAPLREKLRQIRANLGKTQ